MKTTFKSVLLFFLIAVAIYAKPISPMVAVLQSNYTRDKTPNPIFFDWEMNGVFQTLKALKVPYRLLTDQQLTLTQLKAYRLLILPNSKNMTPNEVESVEQFVRHGGKIFATGFSSYRNENDQLVGAFNNFQLSTLFGADYLRFDSTPPHAGFIRDRSGKMTPLGRNMAIFVHPHAKSQVLGVWIDNNGASESITESLDAAIIENSQQNAIYVGENLFAPENSWSVEVKTLIGSLLNKLLPGCATPPAHASQETYPVLPELKTLAPLSSGKNISVGLPYPIHSGYITSQAPFSLYNENKQLLATYSQNSNVNFQAEDAGFSVERKFMKRCIFEPTDPQHPLEIILWHGSRSGSPFKFGAFRGELILQEANGEKILVNHLPLEAYLAGVVSHEVPFYFHQEALKTMAVVARTFATMQIKAKKFNGYDICATVSCQAYDGLAYEADAARKAVEQTSGIIVTYQNKLADLPYFATCGGITEDIDKAWNLAPVPYLRAVVDGKGTVGDLSSDATTKQFLLHPPSSYCDFSSRFRWKENYTREELENLFNKSLPVLLKHPVAFTQLLDLKITGRTPHGRVTHLQIMTDTETFDIGKDQIRWLFSGGQIGLGGLQSTMFVIDKKRDSNGNLIAIEILGGGWGHGVGLCQFGAQGMATQGYTYPQILQHYFPGTQLRTQ